MIKVVNDDCRNILSKMGENCIQLVLTDPPYFLDGLDENWDKGKENSVRATGSVGGLPVAMGFNPEQGVRLQNFIYEVSCLLRKVLVPGAFMLVFSQLDYLTEWL